MNPLIYATLALIAHLLGNPHYGFFRDELYFIMCGFHPAFGYVDQPPLVPLLAAGTQIFGDSLFLLRAVPAILSAASVYATCRITQELGGGKLAQGLAAMTAFLCPVLMAFGVMLGPDSVGLLTWPLATLLILRALRGNNPSWLWAGVTLGISFQAKHSIVFFAVALLIGLLLTRHRRVLLSPWCLGGVAIAAVVALPNAIWQWQAGFPMFELLKNGQVGKNVVHSPFEFLVTQLIVTNPIFVPVWFTGLVWLLRKPGLRYLGVTYLVLIAEMILLHGKHYYAASIYPVLFAAGAVALEKKAMIQPALRWGVVPIVLLASLVFVPYVMPVLPVDYFVRFNERVGPVLGLDRAKTEIHEMGQLPQVWADMHGWRELADEVTRVYRSLSPEDQKRAVIFAQNYGEAAAIEFFGTRNGLPPVISGHNHYFLWGTRGQSGEVLIDVNGDCGAKSGTYKNAQLAGTFRHPWVMPYENNLPIMVCRGLSRPLTEIWPLTKKYI